jgi:formylglycine-generating enzyme required for sulfatase activity
MPPTIRTLALVAALAGGCHRSPQWLVLATTDTTAPIWGDRVLFEILDQSGNLACDDCRREIPVTDASFPVSFGVAAPAAGSGEQLRVRGRFYRASQVGADGLPQGTALIDATGILPALPGGSSARVVLDLTGFCYGQPADIAGHQSCRFAQQPDGSYLAQTVDEVALTDEDIAAGPFVPGHLFSSLGHCPAAVPQGMACVDPQAFVLGSTQSVGVDGDVPSAPELVRQPMLPFWIDLDEMTVGTVRPLIAGGQLASSGLLRKGDPGVPDTCTWLGANDASHDDWPLNCVSRTFAIAACEALGRELPDEGQWEAAARNGPQGTRYPWGDTPPTCADTFVSVDATCVRAGPAPSPQLNDQTTLHIRNLGGNLSEWVDGILVDYAASCWSSYGGMTGTALYDADCVWDPAGAGWTGPWPHRGGSWDRRGSSAAGFARFSSPDGGPSPSIGFRCAEALPTCNDLCSQLLECVKSASPGQPTSQAACVASCNSLRRYQLDGNPLGRGVFDNLQVCSRLDCATLIQCNSDLASMTGVPTLKVD